MITVEEIKQKAFRKYNDYLRSLIAGDSSFFPLVIKGNKQNEKDIALLQQQQVSLFQNEKTVVGFGYTIQSEIADSRRGSIHTIKSIQFETEIDYLEFIERRYDAHNFKILMAHTVNEFAELKHLLIEKPEIISENLVKWTDILKVCRYFKTNPHSNLYIRELPVAVHTKFIENNKGILRKLLDVILEGHINSQSENFEDRFGLKTKHNLIRIRFLDSRLSPLPGFEEIGVAAPEINRLAISCKRVFVIENDITALVFPKLNDSIVLFGGGYNLASLKSIDWLNECEVFYWSDIDAHGFEMLSQMRRHYPHTQSFLMDETTFNEFWAEDYRGEMSMNPAPNLTESETEFRERLLANNKRLEQEKIPLGWIEAHLKPLLGA